MEARTRERTGSTLKGCGDVAYSLKTPRGRVGVVGQAGRGVRHSDFTLGTL